MPHRLKQFLLCVSLLAVLAQAVNLCIVLGHESAGRPAYHMYDTESYLINAQAWRDGVPFSPAFRERVLLPALIAWCKEMGLPEWSILWLPVLFQGCVVYALGWLAYFISRRAVVAVTTSILCVIYPSFYQYVPLLGTDALGTQFLVLGIVMVLYWAEDKRMFWGFLSAGLWGLAQITRPTFFPVALIMPFLLHSFWESRKGRWVVGVFASSLLIIPLYLAGTNYLTYGVFRPTLTAPEVLSRSVVPKINALKRNSEVPGSLSKYWEQERDQKAYWSEDWQTLGLYEAGLKDRSDFRNAYQRLMESSQAYIKTNRNWFWRGALIPYYHLYLNQPPRYAAWDVSATNLNNQQLWFLRFDKMLVIFSLFGFIRLARFNPFMSIFWIGLCAIMLVPLVIFMWMPAATRLPVDAISLPLIAWALCDYKAWGGFLFWSVAGWLPWHIGLTTAAGPGVVLLLAILAYACWIFPKPSGLMLPVFS